LSGDAGWGVVAAVVLVRRDHDHVREHTTRPQLLRLSQPVVRDGQDGGDDADSAKNIIPMTTASRMKPAGAYTIAPSPDVFASVVSPTALPITVTSSPRNIAGANRGQRTSAGVSAVTPPL